MLAGSACQCRRSSWAAAWHTPAAPAQRSDAVPQWLAPGSGAGGASTTHCESTVNTAPARRMDRIVSTARCVHTDDAPVTRSTALGASSAAANTTRDAHCSDVLDDGPSAHARRASNKVSNVMGAATKTVANSAFTTAGDSAAASSACVAVPNHRGKNATIAPPAVTV